MCHLLVLIFYIYIYIYIERERERERVCAILSNATPSNNLLLNSYFENLTVRLHVLYVFNIHAKFYTNQIYLLFDP